MAARISTMQMYSSFLNDLNNVTTKLTRSQEQLASGRRIERPSDDPFGTSQTLSFDAQLSDVRQYQRNVGDAQGWVQTSSTALGATLTALQRVRELTLQAANGTYNAQDLQTIAAEVSQLKEVVRDRANTRFGSQYVFAGTATSTEPYPVGFNTSQGNALQINRRVGPGLQVQMNVAGSTVFDNVPGAPPLMDDLFVALDTIIANMQAGTPASRNALATTGLQALEVHMDHIIQQRASHDATASRLDVNEQQLSSLEERLMEARSAVADTDMAKAFVEFQGYQTMYESALAAGSRIMQTSILDFL